MHPGSSIPFPHRQILAATALALGLVLGACDGVRPPATGAADAVGVVADTTQGLPAALLHEILEAPILTLPVPEPAYRLDTVAADPGAVRRRRNVLIVGAPGDGTPAGDLLRDFAPEGAPPEGVVAARADLWAEGQTVVLVAAPTPEKLPHLLQERAADVRAFFDAAARDRLAAEMFARGRQVEVEERLMAGHGFAVNVQHDYGVVTDTTGFVRLRRLPGDTWRDLFVFYAHAPALPTIDRLTALLDSLGQRHLRGNLGGHVSIDHRRPLETRSVKLAGRPAVEMRGLWRLAGTPGASGNTPLAQGGPFVAYAFRDEATGRLYLIAGLVFAPGHDKKIFVRQMEAIAHTFRTHADGGTGAL